MNELDKTRGNRARRDKDSILADTKNLLAVLYPAIQNMAKIERIEGSPVEIKRACREIIRHFSIAKECPEVRDEHIRQMIGEYGILQIVWQYGIIIKGNPAIIYSRKRKCDSNPARTVGGQRGTT